KVSWDELVAELSPADRQQRAAWRAQIHALEARKPAPLAQAWAIRDADKAAPTYVLHRGDPKRKGALVQPAFPRVLSESVRARESAAAHSPALSRLDLARWLTSTDHPLTARVLVNRVWQHHFGRGLVATPNDFGLRGEPPSHPELLDWLAPEFMAHGWSIKHLHRLMVLSATYPQTSRWGDRRGRRIDPENRLLARMNRRRLDGEALRDSALAVAGTLNSALGGPLVRVPLEPEVYDLIFTEEEPDGLWPVTPDT